MVVLGDATEEKQKVEQEPSADASRAPTTETALGAGTEHAEAAVPGCSPASSAWKLQEPMAAWSS